MMYVSNYNFHELPNKITRKLMTNLDCCFSYHKSLVYNHFQKCGHCENHCAISCKNHNNVICLTIIHVEWSVSATFKLVEVFRELSKAGLRHKSLLRSRGSCSSHSSGSSDRSNGKSVLLIVSLH